MEIEKAVDKLRMNGPFKNWNNTYLWEVHCWAPSAIRACPTTSDTTTSEI